MGATNVLALIPTIPEHPRWSRLSIAYNKSLSTQGLRMLAQYEAEKAVKLALKGQGLKPQYIARREIVTMAKDYLAAHPELLAQAKPIVEQWRREEFFGKRAARVERNSQHLHKSRSAEPQGLSLCETLERNGAAK